MRGSCWSLPTSELCSEPNTGQWPGIVLAIPVALTWLLTRLVTLVHRGAEKDFRSIGSSFLRNAVAPDQCLSPRRFNMPGIALMDEDEPFNFDGVSLRDRLPASLGELEATFVRLPRFSLSVGGTMVYPYPIRRPPDIHPMLTLRGPGKLSPIFPWEVLLATGGTS